MNEINATEIACTELPLDDEIIEGKVLLIFYLIHLVIDRFVAIRKRFPLYINWHWNFFEGFD
jgi:hypothetical protein